MIAILKKMPPVVKRGHFYYLQIYELLSNAQLVTPAGE
ncbi:hypothetical protein CCP3SC15_490012 [Gammaproteobacteria bacterium]